MRRAFTLVELLIVIIIISILASVAAPRVTNGVLRGKEAQLRENLAKARTAMDRFYANNGVYPGNWQSLVSKDPTRIVPDVFPAVSAAPEAGKDYGGPYLDSIPMDPMTNGAFQVDVVSTTGAAGGRLVVRVHSGSTLRGTDGRGYDRY